MSGDGSIWRRTRTSPDGRMYVRWVAQISHGGREDRHVQRRVCRSRAEAVAAIEEMKRPSPTSPSLGTFLRSWLDETVRRSVSHNTARGYEAVIAEWAPLADYPVHELVADDIEYVLNRMTAQRKGQERPTPASPKTRRNALAMLRQALDKAVERGYAARNEARLVRMPRVPRRQRDAMTPERAKAILEATKDDRYAAAYALGMCGLRMGEVLGLAWEDVDLDAGTVLVRWQLVGSGRRAGRAQLKTAASEAPIAVPSFVVERLRQHRMSQVKERLASGLNTQEGLVFLTERLYAVNASWLTKHFRDLLTAAKMEPMTFHALRHGTAALLAQAGVHPRVAQEYLRHAQVRTTMEVYTAVTRGQQREAAETLERMVGG